ncbi:hypothetical protein [Singulisphaera acidiphila]|nr:hypothetical protein [Singulisphaera acidiphila]
MSAVSPIGHVGRLGLSLAATKPLTRNSNQFIKNDGRLEAHLSAVCQA